MEKLVAAAWAAGAYKIMLLTGKTQGAAGFYRKLGFRPTLDDALCLYLPLAVLRQTRA